MLKLKYVTYAVLSLTLTVTNAFGDSVKSMVSVPNVGQTLLNQADIIGAMEPSTEINFTVWLKLTNQTQLKQFIQDLYDPLNPNYQHFLSKQEFDALYGPSRESALSVQQYFTAAGLKAEIIDNHVDVKGTVSQINQALHIKLKNYNYKNKIVYGITEEPKIAANISQYVNTITGLDDVPVFFSYL